MKRQGTRKNQIGRAYWHSKSICSTFSILSVQIGQNREGEHRRLEIFSRVAMALVHILHIIFFSLGYAEIDEMRFQNDYQALEMQKLDERSNRTGANHPPS